MNSKKVYRFIDPEIIFECTMPKSLGLTEHPFAGLVGVKLSCVLIDQMFNHLTPFK